MWDCVLGAVEKESTVPQVSLSPVVKLILLNYQVQLDSEMTPSLMVTIILTDAVIPDAFKAREKCCTGSCTPLLPTEQAEQSFHPARHSSLQSLQLEVCTLHCDLPSLLHLLV